MNRFYVWLSAALMRVIAVTLRLKIDDRGGVFNRPEHPPFILAFWHNRLALMAVFAGRYCRGRTILTLISRSRDGEFISDVAAQFGIKAARGSSSRHGVAAALTAVHASRDPRTDIVITPDGPRGPRYQIQPGLLRLAQTTERPIVAVTYRLGWKWALKSWDRFQVPIPFSTCHLITHEPIFVPAQATEAELSAISARVVEALGGD
ncbi:MAG: lysophospholipid acyltransferase family protein [Methylacidiphilales bacterium]|nr:lysophospholipid acyltransferase family protein [Candidatus Methylacidiphilales bacterium]